MTRTRSTRPWLYGMAFLSLGAAAATAGSATADSRAEFDLALSEFDRAQDLPANKSVQARLLYRSAAQRLESIVADGVINGKLEYNLGNCFLQAGDIGLAILHYRRAERHIPRDPYLTDNLREAKSRCLAKISATRRSFMIRNLFFWHFGTSVAGRTFAAVCAGALFWLLLAARSSVRRRGVTMAVWCSGLVAIMLAGSSATTHWLERHTPAGVVVGMDVIAYKGPGMGYARQFAQPLQPGVEFTLAEARPSGWWRIRLPDGKTGWIEAGAAELVTASTPISDRSATHPPPREL